MPSVADRCSVNNKGQLNSCSSLLVTNWWAYSCAFTSLWHPALVKAWGNPQQWNSSRQNCSIEPEEPCLSTVLTVQKRNKKTDLFWVLDEVLLSDTGPQVMLWIHSLNSVEESCSSHSKRGNQVDLIEAHGHQDLVETGLWSPVWRQYSFEDSWRDGAGRNDGMFGTY